MVERFKGTGHPVFKSISALSRGNLRRMMNRDSKHFNTDALNKELVCRTLHSANQLSIHGAVSNWCEEFGLKPNERKLTSERFKTKENEQILQEVTLQEVNSLVQWRKKSNLQHFARMRHSREESVLECSAKPLQT